MFIPLRTAVDVRRRTVVVPLLVVLNAIVMLIAVGGGKGGVLDPDRFYSTFALSRGNFQWWQPLTYQFLHDPRSIWHLLFNMVFLFAFGTAVEARLGRIGMLVFYLVGGAVAGVGHMLVSAASVIGASGAVAAVTGAYLAFFPRSRVLVLGFFPILGVFPISALWIIAIYFGIDVASQISAWLGHQARAVAYMAHIAGYLYGFGVAFLLLATRIVPRHDVDVFFLFRQWRRRAGMRAVARGGETWQHQYGRIAAESRAAAARRVPHRDPAPGAARSAGSPSAPAAERSATDQAGAPSVASPETAALRAQMQAHFTRRDIPAAAQTYLELLRRTPELTLNEEYQLDVGNQLLSDGRGAEAAHAYERFLQAYPRSQRADDVRLLLASIYARTLGDSARARPLLEALRSRLRDPARLAFTETLLSELAT